MTELEKEAQGYVEMFTYIRTSGRYYWTESFTDEDTGKLINVERSRPVKVDAIWDEIAVKTLVI